MSAADPSSLAARLRAPYRLALAAAPLALLGGGGLTLIAPLSASAEPLSASHHALLSAGGVGACFVAMVLSRALLRPERVEESEDPARYVWAVFVLTWALCAVSALLGLALCALTGQLGDAAPSVLVSLLTTLAHPPTEARLRAALGARA